MTLSVPSDATDETESSASPVAEPVYFPPAQPEIIEEV